MNSKKSSKILDIFLQHILILRLYSYDILLGELMSSKDSMECGHFVFTINPKTFFIVHVIDLVKNHFIIFIIVIILFRNLEIKWILEHKELQINKKENIHPDALDFYFTVGYIPAPLTIYKNLRKLEAAENLIIKNINGELVIESSKYYEIPDFAPENDQGKAHKRMKRTPCWCSEDSYVFSWCASGSIPLWWTR